MDDQTIRHFRHWSRHRQHLGQQGASAEEALKATTGVYSAHPSGPLSLFARVQNLTKTGFHCIDNQKLGLRVPAMRESVYLLPHDAAPLAMAACLPPPGDKAWERRYSQKGREIPPEYYEEWKEEALRVAQKPVKAAELKKQAGVPPDKLKFVLNRMAFEGYLLRIGADSLRSNIIAYVGTEAWTGQPLPLPPTEEAQAWLAGQYLRSFGPARQEDFQWWAGITKTEASNALNAVDTAVVEGEYLLPAALLNDFQSFRLPTGDTVDILPQWDSYSMGYAPDGRQRFASADVLGQVYGKLGATGGNAMGVVLINGLAHATWKPKFSGKTMNVELKAFEKLPAGIMKTVEARFFEIGGFLEAKKVAVSWLPVS